MINFTFTTRRRHLSSVICGFLYRLATQLKHPSSPPLLLRCSLFRNAPLYVHNTQAATTLHRKVLMENRFTRTHQHFSLSYNDARRVTPVTIQHLYTKMFTQAHIQSSVGPNAAPARCGENVQRARRFSVMSTHASIHRGAAAECQRAKGVI